jgi:hypothetical protein
MMSKIAYGHYTSLTGLLGIVKTETLWATNVKFLNDAHEFQHALELIKDLISESKIPPEHPDHKVHKDYVAAIAFKLKTLDSYDSASVFTLSFSEETDLLSQWRGYCPSNNGYCITYDITKLHEKIKSVFDDCHLFKCVYDNKQKERQLKDLLNTYWQKYRMKNNNKLKESIIDDLTRQIILLASYFKHPSFKEEKEHRIVIVLEYAPDNDLKFREGPFSLIPYIELPVPRSFITKFCIGPTSNRSLAKRALETFFETQYGYPTFVTDFNIEFSETSYRPR